MQMLRLRWGRSEKPTLKAISVSEALERMISRHATRVRDSSLKRFGETPNSRWKTEDTVGGRKSANLSPLLQWVVRATTKFVCQLIHPVALARSDRAQLFM